MLNGHLLLDLRPNWLFTEVKCTSALATTLIFAGHGVRGT